jgi:hypothetical protein
MSALALRIKVAHRGRAVDDNRNIVRCGRFPKQLQEKGSHVPVFIRLHRAGIRRSETHENDYNKG